MKQYSVFTPWVPKFYASNDHLYVFLKQVSLLMINRGGSCIRSIRIDLCCSVLDAATRRKPSSEVLTFLYSTIARLPLEKMNDLPGK